LKNENDIKIKITAGKTNKNENYYKLEILSMERGICPIAVFYFALKRSFFNI